MQKNSNINQKGFALVPLLIVCGILLIAIVFFVIASFKGSIRQTDQKKSSPTPTTKIDFKTKCIKRDYNGCDDNQTFYNWKGDNKP